MQKLFSALIIFFSFINICAIQQEMKEKRSFDSNFADTIKSVSIQIPDTTKKVSSDTIKTIQRERLIPLTPNNSLSAYRKEIILRSNELQNLDTRYTGDFISYSPFGFVRDLGSIGQPNEVVIYGNGFGNSSYLVNGISTNNRLTNSLDLNLFQSESIDSIEIIPLPQGFLYNEMNNPATVNFISRDFHTSKPYSRIRFYQAPNEEGFFDGIFSSNLSRRLGLYTELTHQSTDPKYKNTDYGLWAGSVRLRYLLNNSFNIIGGYSYYQSNVGLNGGVDLDSIKQITPANQVEEILFSSIQAPVNYIDRYQKVSSHNLNVRVLANLIGNKPTDLTFYYQSSLIEFRQNENISPVPSTWKWDSSWRYERIIHDNEFNTYGAKLSQKFETAFLNIYSEALYESTKLNSPLVNSDERINAFSALAKASLILSNDEQKIIPSFFGKYLNYDGSNYFGAGAEFSWIINNNFSIYTGFSKYQRPFNYLRLITNGIPLNDNQSDYTILETSIGYNDKSLNVSAGYFLQELVSKVTNDKTLQGLNLKFDWHLWKILLSTNSTYYFIQDDKDNFPLPDFTSNGGIYYVDTLFNSNLKLKTGINYHLIGKRGYQFIDFETFEIVRSIRTNGNVILPFVNVKPSVQFDFFLAGKIQDAATIYFVFENMLNEKYYIVPYYPKQERGLRLGVAWEFLD
jgi:hypothetical protein